VRISSGRESTQPTMMQKNTHKDMWELSLVKTVMEHPDTREMILDLIDPSLLKFHFDEFQLALQNHYDNPTLMAISVDTTIQSFKTQEEIKEELNAFLKRNYERALKQLSMQRDMPFEKKTFLIRQYRDKIASLAKGKNV
jgi:DNA primase